MDNGQKYEFNQQIDKYMDDNQVYELFQDLFQQLMVSKPDNPLDFLIQQLDKKPARRIFIMGPPGTFRTEITKAISEEMGWTPIQLGFLMKQEVNQKSQLGAKIDEAKKAYTYVDDQIVLEIVKKHVQDCEAKGKSWALQGFPRTKAQALALQSLGIIPDKFILLNCKPQASVSRLKTNLLTINQQLYGPDLEELANQCLQEYDLNMKGVREPFGQFLYEYDVTDKSYNDVVPDVCRMLNLRFRESASRRPPRIALVGPPGSGRFTQSKALAALFGLVHISVRGLLKNEIQRNPKVGNIISQCMDNGELVPDKIINSLIEKRMEQSDCRVNGWIMEGFLYSRSQINLLKACNIQPSLVITFNQDEETCVRRKTNVRIDPQTGNEYNILDNPPSDEATNNRLIPVAQNSEENIRKQFKAWKLQLNPIEETFREKILNVEADREQETMTDYLAEEIDNIFQTRT